jgi:transposase InsO family protein
LTSQPRSSQRYQRRLAPEEQLLRQQLRLLARRHPRYGYRRIHAILRREGWACNRKRVQRLWRDEGLRLPAKTTRRRRGRRMPGHLVADHPDQVWAIDFVSDRTADGRPIKILTVTDEHTREALATPAARRMGADDTVNTLEQIVERRGRAPVLIRCDNGPEFISQALRDWSLQRHQDWLHRAGSALAEPVRRILQRPLTPRAPRDGELQQPVRSATTP